MTINGRAIPPLRVLRRVGAPVAGRAPAAMIITRKAGPRRTAPREAGAAVVPPLPRSES